MNEIQTIQNRIYEIRGQRVMLDFDLAAMYGVETRALKQSVKRNIERFTEDFMFQLTKGELEILKSQIVTSNVVDNQDDSNWKSQIATSNHQRSIFGYFLLLDDFSCKVLLYFQFYLYFCNQVSADRRDATLLRQKATWM